MKTKLMIIMLFAFMSRLSLAQDVITYKNGTEVRGKVAEISTTEIKYRQEDNPDGPLYTLPKKEIFMILYANGHTDVFGEIPPQKEMKNTQNQEKTVYDDRIKYSGPRIGLTVIGEGRTHDYIVDSLGRNAVITQFGWQLETRVFTAENGMTGLIEWVGLLGGVEQGLFLPSLTSLFGIRDRKGREFGMGPNLSVSGVAMAFAVGTSFHSGNVYYPVNLALVTSVPRKEYVYNELTGGEDEIFVNTGIRVGLTVGFNTRKK